MDMQIYFPYILQIFFFILMQYLSISQGAIVVGGFFSLGGLAPNYICNDDVMLMLISLFDMNLLLKIALFIIVAHSRGSWYFFSIFHYFLP